MQNMEGGEWEGWNGNKNKGEHTYDKDRLIISTTTYTSEV